MLLSTDEEFVQAVLDLLRALFDDDDQVLITHQSLRRLLDVYEKDLVAAVRVGTGLRLLRDWKREATSFRQHWLGSVSTESVMFHGMIRKVLTESSTMDAKAKCAAQKEKAGGQTPAAGV